MAKDAYFFSHDSNARTDTKIVDMMYDYGVAGYGMFWFIVEIMRENDGYKIENNKSTSRALAMQMHSKCEEVQCFITKCVEEYKLFDTDGTYIWSKSLLRRMEKVEEVRTKRKAAAEKRWKNTDKTIENDTNALESDANAMQMHSKSNANEMQLDAKENKVKEKKVKEIIYMELEYTELVQLTEINYNKLLNEYDKNYVESKIIALDNYLQSNPNKYKNHYATLLQWIKKDGNKAVVKMKPRKQEELPAWADWS